MKRIELNWKNKELMIAYRFPWEFIFISWDFSYAIRIWVIHGWVDVMRNLWRDVGFRLLGIEVVYRVYGNTDKCECGKRLTQGEIEINERVARETNTDRMDMCSKCWEEYCEHAITGE